MEEESENVFDNSALTNSLMGLAVTGGLMNIIGGMMSKMFGSEKTPQKLAEEMMAGAVRGILDHFDYKMDDLKRNIEKLQEENANFESDNESLKAQLEECKSSKTTTKTKKK